MPDHREKALNGIDTGARTLRALAPEYNQNRRVLETFQFALI